MRTHLKVALLPGMLVAAAAGGAPAAASAPPAAGAYCDAHLALEAAIISEDPDAIGAAVEGASAAAPDEIAASLQAAVANAPSDGPPSPDYIVAYNEVATWVADNCGFGRLQVLAQDYTFGGLAEEVPGGPTVIELVNEGTEWHEIVLLKRADGFDAPLEDVLAMMAEDSGEGSAPPDGSGPPDGEMGDEPISFAGAAFAEPGSSGFAVADLAPGRYIALCFIPVGTTPEVFEHMMEEMDAGSGPPMEGSGPPMEEGPPHFTEGMVAEFTVT